MDPGHANSVLRMSAYSEPGEREMFTTGGSFAIRGFWPPTDSVVPDPPSIFVFSKVKFHPPSVSGSVLVRSDDPRKPARDQLQHA